MSKNIVVCCDGTSNQLNGDLTNVVRMFEICEKNEQQAAFYDPGVGTLADPAARGPISKRWSMIKGLAFGAGLQDNVLEAYRFLMRTYEKSDHIFLFGFSRGAFTVRVLAGMIHGMGLLNAGTENLLPYLWRCYRGIRILPSGANAQEREKADRHQREVEAFRRSFTRTCRVAFLGPWDTVGSVGMYNWNQSFPHSSENDSVDIVRHAVSLDERRAGFRSNVFKADDTITKDGRKRVKNVWFPGVHCDIGGGYEWPAGSGLAMIPFLWMVREAKEAGLLIDDSKVKALTDKCTPDTCAPMGESLKGAWKLMEFLPARRYDWTKRKTVWRWKPGKPREMREAPILHRSVLTRMDNMSSYQPKGLPKDHQFPIED